MFSGNHKRFYVVANTGVPLLPILAVATKI
jgi:hypothetical protein